jgi:hypothetical protein
MLTTRKIARARARGLRLVSQILLAIQLLSLGHLLSARHITCPEHGDIMHVESSAGALPAPGTDVPIRPALASSGSTAGADHHHCLVCADANRRCLLAGPAEACVTPVFIACEAHPVATVFRAPIDLILLAPKSSPPSV